MYSTEEEGPGVVETLTFSGKEEEEEEENEGMSFEKSRLLGGGRMYGKKDLLS